MRRSHRQGFSLLEVLLATGMLIGSAIVLMELASIGNRHAASARDLSRSQLICQTKLNEIVCGIAPAEEVRPTPLEDDPRWVYWVETMPAEQPGLLIVEVGAAYEPAPRQQKSRYTLVRWVRASDPLEEKPAPVLASPSTASPSTAASGGIVP
jgi:hypothetical protein